MSKMTKAQAGSLGGRATVARHGHDHMRIIGQRGAAATWQRYQLVPAGLSDLAMVRKDNGALIAFLSGDPRRVTTPRP